ncbi:hypothetical protein ABEW19_28280 [Paenibacillus illinoisensis]|uniref:hypothetical protein n=1 Tax=Paenibacillus illinoisensis TaxID=59845 RepID=UPI003D2BE3E4
MPMDRYLRQIKKQGEPMKSLPSTSVKDQLLKRKLYDILRKNDRRKKLMNGWAHFCEWFGYIALVLFGSFMLHGLSIIFKGAETPWYYGPIGAALLLCSYYSFVMAKECSGRYVKRTYNDRTQFLGYNYSSYHMEVLFSLQCDAVYDYLKNNDTRDPDLIDYLIDYYTAESESIRKRRWVPFAIFIAFSLPAWASFIRSQLGDWSNIKAIPLFFFFTAGITVIVWLFKKCLDNSLFKKPNDYLQLANILRTIKNN